jgi:hypothetical protein
MKNNSHVGFGVLILFTVGLAACSGAGVEPSENSADELAATTLADGGKIPAPPPKEDAGIEPNDAGHGGGGGGLEDGGVIPDAGHGGGGGLEDGGVIPDAGHGGGGGLEDGGVIPDAGHGGGGGGLEDAGVRG